MDCFIFACLVCLIYFLAHYFVVDRLTPSAARSGAPQTSTTPSSGGGGQRNPQQQALDLARILADLGAGSSTESSAESSSSNPVTSNTNTTTASSTTETSTTATVNASSSNNAGNDSATLSAADIARAFASNTTLSSLGNTIPNEMYNRDTTNLNQVLTADAILATGVLDDPSVREGLIRLLPEDQQTEEYLETNIRSPQFQQALDALGGALCSENFNTVMANLGIDPAPGADWLV